MGVRYFTFWGSGYDRTKAVKVSAKAWLGTNNHLKNIKCKKVKDGTQPFLPFPTSLRLNAS
mgnify:CR=1 FL=1